MTTYAMRCQYVPPHIQQELAKRAKGEAADERQQRLDDEARAERAQSARERSERVAGSATQVAGPSLAPPATGTSRREVYDSGHAEKFKVQLVRAEGAPETADAAVTAAYDNSGTVRQFYQQVLGRNSIDNRGLDLVLNVHFSSNYNNAFWFQDQMTFGDGDGVIFVGFAQSMDVVAHELAHGVTEYTSALEYQGESGALNEHFSDMLGTTITQWANHETPANADWLIGDEIMGPSLFGEALRSMSHPGTAYDNPLMGKDPQPAHYSDRYTGSKDNGGVHINSGIPNRAFYLTATELGDTVMAARIWYHALQFLPKKATMAQASAQTAESARILVRSGGVRKGATQIVRGAWDAVGL